MAFDINEQEFHDKNDEIFKPVSLLSRKAGSFPAALAKALTATTAAAIAAATLISSIHMTCTPVSIEENHATFEITVSGLGENESGEYALVEYAEEITDDNYQQYLDGSSLAEGSLETSPLYVDFLNLTPYTKYTVILFSVDEEENSTLQFTYNFRTPSGNAAVPTPSTVPSATSTLL